jgi:hypothetical protein
LRNKGATGLRNELAWLDRPYRHEPASPSGTRATGSATPRTDLALLRFKIALLKLKLKALHPSHYDPNQPRVPAGNPDGGQWTTGEGAAGVQPEPSELEQALTTASDQSTRSDLSHLAVC